VLDFILFQTPEETSEAFQIVKVSLKSQGEEVRKEEEEEDQQV